ncbi:hypothetical protein HDU99_004276 [Rhizoclosmatium hyalinum]|nr:hypothetical protein HDU99_004276 [Rhizoclosmatium hyalinum]
MPVIPSNQPIDPVLLARFNGSMKNAVQAMQVMQLMQSGLTLAQCMVKLLPIPQEGEPKRVLKSGKCYILNPQTGLKEFFCPVCYKPYTTSNGLRYHIKYLHSNSRGFPEGYRFGDTGDLGQDGGPLVGESEDEEDDVAGPSKDLFECMSPGCGKKYGSLNGLRYHAKRCGLPKGSVPNDYQPKSNKKKMAIAALIQAGAAQMAAQNAASGSGSGVVIPTMPIPMAAGPSVQMNVGASSGSGSNPLDSLSFLATVATADAARTVSSAKPPSVVTAASTSTVSSTKPSSASVAAASVAAAAKAADLAAAKAAQIAAAAAAANAAAKAANEAARAANIAAANAQAAAIAARRKRTAELVWGDGSELSDVSDVSSDEED